MPANLTLPQLRALYWLAKWATDVDGEFQDDWMRKQCGPAWRPPLRRAVAEVSRELARATHGRKRR